MITSEHIQGHWRRKWIEVPGFKDDTTRVHWMQAGSDYADVRFPLERPDVRGATCLADLPPASLLALAQAEGFAGHVTLDGNTCTWHREINWHGAPHEEDAGALSFDDDGRMIERGVHADYAELWEQRAASQPQSFRFSDGDYVGLLVVVGRFGVLGIGRPSKPATRPLIDASKAGRTPADTAVLFDGLHALCRIEGDQVVASLATNPLVEGQAVLTFRDGLPVWHKTGFDGDRSTVSMQARTVPA